MKKLIHRQASMEAKLTDQEGRARWDNLRINGIPEKEEGDNICAFLEKLLRDVLDFPGDTELRIEQAHRTRAAKPEGLQARPQSIIAKFMSYREEEEKKEEGTSDSQSLAEKGSALQEHSLLCGSRLPIRGA